MGDNLEDPSHRRLEAGGMNTAHRQLIVGQAVEQSQRVDSAGGQAGQQIGHAALLLLLDLSLVPVIQREALG